MKHDFLTEWNNIKESQWLYNKSYDYGNDQVSSVVMFVPLTIHYYAKQYSFMVEW